MRNLRSPYLPAAGMAAVIALMAAAPAFAACDSYDYITNGGTSQPIELVYSESHACGTCPDQDLRPVLCQRWNKLVLPNVEDRNWSYGPQHDLVPIPHRGRWGPGGSSDQGPSENTMAALELARTEGYAYIEIDASINDNGTVYLGHYFSMEAVAGKKSENPISVPETVLFNSKMRKRDQSKSASNADSIIPISDALDWAAQNNIILLIDPKVAGNQTAPNDKYYQVIATVMKEAAGTCYKYEIVCPINNIVIKTDRTYAATYNGVTPYFGPWDPDLDELWGRVMWSPIVNKDTAVAKEVAKDNVKGWVITNDRRNIATIEVSLFSSTHWSANCISMDSTNYPNLISYIIDFAGRRPAIWSVDPMGDKGTFGREYNWKFIGNTSDDIRGNPYTNLSYRDAMYVAVNTDRPDWYNDMVTHDFVSDTEKPPNTCQM